MKITTEASRKRWEDRAKQDKVVLGPEHYEMLYSCDLEWETASADLRFAAEEQATAIWQQAQGRKSIEETKDTIRRYNKAADEMTKVAAHIGQTWGYIVGNFDMLKTLQKRGILGDGFEDLDG